MGRDARASLRQVILREHSELLRRTLFGEIAGAAERDAWLRQHPAYARFMRWHAREYPPNRRDNGEEQPSFDAIVARYVDMYGGVDALPQPSGATMTDLPSRRIAAVSNAPIAGGSPDPHAWRPRTGQREPARRDIEPHALIGWIVAPFLAILLLGMAMVSGGTLGGAYPEMGVEAPAEISPQSQPAQQLQGDEEQQGMESCLQGWLEAQEEFINALAGRGAEPVVAPPPRPTC